MRDLGRADLLTAGAVGPPGRRAFYLEASTPAGDHWFLMEKEQVKALANRLRMVLRRLGLGPADPASAPELRPPDEPLFRVGDITVRFDSGRFVISLEPVGEDEVGAEFSADPDQVAAMAARALAVVAAGRPQCPRCSLPIDPDGHVCPASNGDLRRRR